MKLAATKLPVEKMQFWRQMLSEPAFEYGVTSHHDLCIPGATPFLLVGPGAIRILSTRHGWRGPGKIVDTESYCQASPIFRVIWAVINGV